MNPAYRRHKYHFLRRRSMEAAYGKSLGTFVRSLKPDIVLSANTPTEPQSRLLRECERLEVPFVSWVQDFYSMAVTRLARKKLPVLGTAAGVWYRKLERETLLRSAGVVSITEDFLPTLQGFGLAREKVMVAPNWAPLDDLPVRPRANAWAHKRGLDDCFCFLYSGTLAMKHNPNLLLRLALRFRKHPNVRVVVVSEGPGADWLAQEKARTGLTNLRVFPFQEFERMPDVLATGDVLVAVLENDAGIFSVPSKVLTYLCGARPILAAIPSANLAARTIREARAGIVVDPETSDAFVSAAEEMYQDVRLRADAGKRGRAWAESHFDIGPIADQFEEFLGRLLTAATRSDVRLRRTRRIPSRTARETS